MNAISVGRERAAFQNTFRGGRWLAAVVIAVLCAAPNARAIVLLQEDFNGYANTAAIKAAGWTNGNKEVEGDIQNPPPPNPPVALSALGTIHWDTDATLSGFGNNVTRAPAAGPNYYDATTNPTGTDGKGQGRIGHGYTATTASVATPLSFKWSFYDNGDHSTAVSPTTSLTYSKVPFSVMDLKNSSDRAIIQIGLSPILDIFGSPSDVNTFQCSTTLANGTPAGSLAFNLASLRPTSPGWTTFELVTTGDFASLYVNGSSTPDANFDNLPITAPNNGGGFNYDRLRVGSGSSTEGPTGLDISPTVVTAYDNIVVKTLTAEPSDYNGNGEVDAADYVLWRNDPASFGGGPGYSTWRANFGNPPGSGIGLGGAVPEPTSAALALVGLVSLWLGRRDLHR